MTARWHSAVSFAARRSISKSSRTNPRADFWSCPSSAGIPIGNGIITVENEAQAKARASVDDQDKGGGAARAALTLVGLKKRLGKR